ncbi:hypothetical protein GQX73_g620 [Xylaria multiplex]|uniref:Rhodopsin domain-containing protein n=1 Tax=Xylaria multiplex TaxID=323545 RepID=A0A7C8NBD2_9PEZI|nr:hypothetical protein GQX73_g620 [Xylaria multiplex]
MAATIVEARQCTPQNKIWDLTVQGGYCIDLEAVELTTSSINVVSDLVILLAPQHVIWRLQLPRAKKLGIALIFAVGYLSISQSISLIMLNAGVIAAIFRLITTHYYLTSDDVTYTISSVSFWALAEITSVFLVYVKTDRYYLNPDDQEDSEDEDYDGQEDSSIPSEGKWLEILRWAKHIVSGVKLTNDPLAQDFSGVASHHMQADHWVYLECGTLLKLANRARREKIRLPNRVLWRLFLCLLRMCIAMGWPPEQPDGIDPQPVLETATGNPYDGINHGDMHHGNLMFGDFIPEDPNGEHTLTPILKLIDFGIARQVLNTTEKRILAAQDNLFDIGVVMLELVTLDYALAEGIYPRASEAKLFRWRPDHPEILTNGAALLTNENGVNPFPMFDTTLRDLVCACLATEPQNRPSPAALANFTIARISDRDGQFYASRGVGGESDDQIRAYMHHVLYDA